MRIDKVLMPTDFSPAANDAFPAATAWAAHFGAELHVLHAILLHASEPLDDEAGFPSDEQLEQMLGRASSKHLAELETGAEATIVRAHRRGIVAAEVILDYVAEHDIGLIVMATHGRRGPRRLLLGSVTEEVLHRAPCPTLALTRGRTARSPIELGSVVLPIDFSPGSKAALETALSLTGTAGARLHLVHVIEEPPRPIFYDAVVTVGEVLEKQATRELLALFESTGSTDVDVTITVRSGIAASEVLSFAESVEADLIVVPTRGLAGLDHLLLGSVAEKILRGARCEVLVLPPDLADTG